MLSVNAEAFDLVNSTTLLMSKIALPFMLSEIDDGLSTQDTSLPVYSGRKLFGRFVRANQIVCICSLEE